jgi:TBC1 domain family member 15
MIAVNELSNTIDLETTLIRAESLFRRFQRTVEAVDKKSSFPTPNLRQRKPSEPVESDRKTNAPKTSGPGSSSVQRRPGQTSPPPGAEVRVETEKPQVISPELRGLLSRKVEVLNKATVIAHGGGVPA